MGKEITTEVVRKIAQKEDYVLLSEYKAQSVKMDFRCPKGHIWSVRWNDWLQKGIRCGYCSGRYNVNTNKVQQGLAAKGFELIGEYKNANTSIKAKCPNGHITRFRWHRWVKNPTCTECGRRPTITIKKIQRLLNVEGYHLLTETYQNAQQHLDIQCPKQHQYQVTWTNWQQGHRCPVCMIGRTSKAEKEIASLFVDLPLEENNRTILDGKELDIYFPDHKVAIEYCGLYWHCDGAPAGNIAPRYHRDKFDKCKRKDIKLLTIFEDEWLENKDICLSRIKNALGLLEKRIFARQCVTKEISKQEAKEYLEQTHLQGYGGCRIAYGLFYNDELVQVMTFGLPTRAHTSQGKRVLEMKRLASTPNTVVVGGASKLFKQGLQYAKDNEYEVIKSYCDLRWGNGNLYKKLGFIKTYETSYTCHYTDGKQKRYRSQTLATNKKKEQTTELEKMSDKQLHKIYDCGHQTWEYVL